MEIPHHLLHREVACTCGRQHFVPIEQIVVSDDALEQLTAYVKRKSFGQMVVVCDPNTYHVFGSNVQHALLTAGIHSEIKILTSDHDLLPDEEAIASVRSTIQQHGADTAIAVGSGVINDIVRYATYQEGLPYIVIATAPSMDGYASSIAALQFNGVKITLPAQAPQAIFAHPQVLVDAPWELVQSGFGDLVGKVISLLDWKLSHTLYGEYFCSSSYELVRDPLRYCIEHAAQLRARNTEAAKNLFIGLINSGIAMAMMGNSRPCSGSEHHCSHYWDLLAFKHLREHASHGIQVGYATHWMMRFYQQLIRLPLITDPHLPELTRDWEQGVHDFYGVGAKDILAAQQAKRRWLEDGKSTFTEPSMAGLLQALQPELSWFSDASEALSVIGIPETVPFLGVDAPLLRQTFMHAKELRERYTVFDFLEGQGKLEDAIQEVLDVGTRCPHFPV